MRDYVVGNISITVPDRVTFAYNPCIIYVGGVGTGKVTMYVYDEEGRSIAYISTYAINGSVSVDISAYLRSVYSGKNKGTEAFETSAEVSVYVAGTTIPFTVIYGSMHPGETFNPSRNVRLWKAYPQKISVFLPDPSGYRVYTQADSASLVETLVYGWNKPMITQMGYSNASKSAQIVVRPKDNGVSESTFTMEFDGTFSETKEGEGSTIVNITIDSTPQSDSDIFVRWLDKWGFWQYWLFKAGAIELADAVVGEAIAFLTGTTYPYYASRNIGRSLVKSVKVCAPSVTREEWDFLSTIKGSVNVSAYDIVSQVWIPVSISAESHTWKRGMQEQHLQDYAMRIIYPTVQTQRL